MSPHNVRRSENYGRKSYSSLVCNNKNNQLSIDISSTFIYVSKTVKKRMISTTLCWNTTMISPPGVLVHTILQSCTLNVNSVIVLLQFNKLSAMELCAICFITSNITVISIEWHGLQSAWKKGSWNIRSFEESLSMSFQTKTTKTGASRKCQMF